MRAQRKEGASQLRPCHPLPTFLPPASLPYLATTGCLRTRLPLRLSEEKHKKRLLQLNLLLRPEAAVEAASEPSPAPPAAAPAAVPEAKAAFASGVCCGSAGVRVGATRCAHPGAGEPQGGARPSSDSRWRGGTQTRTRDQIRAGSKRRGGRRQAFATARSGSAYDEARGATNRARLHSLPKRVESEEDKQQRLAALEAEKEKARKRAERFGLVPKESGEDADKKRKRDARFNNPTPQPRTRSSNVTVQTISHVYAAGARFDD
ncbi:hypothetical protein L1887_48921 [Cichorium endivia]|nr:hypothetical protein L1887_48921 [Cichorium endivia]